MACEFEKACLKWVMSDCTMEPELCDYAKFANAVRKATLGDPESAVSNWIKRYLDSEEHREQYANREELVEKVKFFEKDFEIIDHIVDIIRTHGLEE